MTDDVKLDRFLCHIDMLILPGCWIWTGARRGYYGGMSEDRLAHVWSYEHFKGSIPDSYQVGHDCHDRDKECRDVEACLHRLCVNPEHLILQTPKDNNNTGRGNQYKEIVKCKYGHAFTEDNIYRFGPGKKWRGCRTCRAARRQGKDPATYVRGPIGNNQYTKRRVQSN